jgi:crotonobetainyl-CoA:carnitine CoA-transferase CaiB-like acyl-CoA transferase
MQFAVNLAMVAGGPLPESVFPRHGAARNPLSGTYKTSDNRWLMLTMLQPGKYWAEFCTVIERPELIGDPRFDTAEKLMGNAPQAAEIIAEVLRGRTFAEWIKIFDGMSGQWAAVQDAWEVSQDPSLRANGLISKLVDYEGRERELLTSPVQFDETPQQLTRAPQFAEHTDELLAEFGFSQAEIAAFRERGVVE